MLTVENTFVKTLSTYFNTLHKHRKKMKGNLTRNGKMLGGYVPNGIAIGIEQWIGLKPERDKSTFLREAARKLLHEEGIPFVETTEGRQ